MKINRKIILPILMFILLATLAYAKSFTDVLGESFSLINNFFKNENYKPYSLIIDFFVFSVVFMAIYMRGVKFAFKDVSKTEKALAVILGLTTAFLMVIGGYSISKILPFVNWLLYFLLFALMWWLLKDMKSKWARFFLALLLTLLLLLIFFALFSGISANISCPESALPWLPWLLALLLFILFWFLLKDIKNAFGRFLLALLLTIAIVLLILFLLKTFSKELGCPEGPFSTNLFDDIGDSFKRMDIGATFAGFGVGEPTLPTLQQVKAPEEKPKIERSRIGDLFGLIPENYKDQAEYNKAVEEAGKKGDRWGGRTYTWDGKELKRNEKVILEKDWNTLKQQREQFQQQREKSAESSGLLFGVPRREGMTMEQYEQNILKEGEKRKQIDGREFYTEKKDDQIILRENKRFWFDPVVDSNKDLTVKKFIEDERKKQQPPPSPAAPPGTPLEPAAPTFPGPSKKSLVDFSNPYSIAIFLIASAILFFGHKRISRWYDKRFRRKKLESSIPEIIAKIELVKKAKENSILILKKVKDLREQLIGSFDAKVAFIRDIATKKGEAYLFEETKLFEKIEEDEGVLIKTENKLVHLATYIGVMEADLLKRIKAWNEVLRRSNINAEEELNELVSIISQDSQGILSTILDLFHLTEQELNLEKDLEKLLKNKVKLIRKRIKKFIDEEHRIEELFEEDDQKISQLLRTMENNQIPAMKKLEEKIQSQAGRGDAVIGDIRETLVIPEEKLKAELKRLNGLKGSIIDIKYPKERKKVSGFKKTLDVMIKDVEEALYLLRNLGKIRREDFVSIISGRTVNSKFNRLWHDLGEGLPMNKFVDILLQSIQKETKAIDSTIKEIKQKYEISRRELIKGGLVAAGGLVIGGTGKTPPKERKLILESAKDIGQKKIRVIFQIRDTITPNAVYNVAAYLESPKSSAKWRKIDVTHTGLKANTTYEKLFVASDFSDGEYNIVLGAITEGIETIFSNAMEIKLGIK